MKTALTERELMRQAKHFRVEAGVTKAQAARDMGVSPVSLHHAEESPDRSLTELRRRMIEKYSSYRVVGPEYRLEKK